MEWLLFGMGAAAVGVSLALGYRERRDFARLQEAAGRQRPGDLEEISLVVSDLEQELAQTAERIVAELEERAATLRGLIAEARTVCGDLGVPEDPGGGIAEPTGLWAADAPGTLEPAGPTSEAADEKRVRESTAGVSQTPTTRARGWRTMEARVWEMSQHGLGVEQIARQLDIGKGEVKLILDLKKAQAR